jgi:hypothetical protein
MSLTGQILKYAIISTLALSTAFAGKNSGTTQTLTPLNPSAIESTYKPENSKDLSELISQAQILAADSSFIKFHDEITIGDETDFEQYMTDDELLKKIQTINPNFEDLNSGYEKQLKDKPWLQRLVFHNYTMQVLNLTAEFFGLETTTLWNFEAIVDFAKYFPENQEQLFTEKVRDLYTNQTREHDFWNFNWIGVDGVINKTEGLIALASIPNVIDNLEKLVNLDAKFTTEFFSVGSPDMIEFLRYLDEDKSACDALFSSDMKRLFAEKFDRDMTYGYPAQYMQKVIAVGRDMQTDSTLASKLITFSNEYHIEVIHELTDAYLSQGQTIDGIEFPDLDRFMKDVKFKKFLNTKTNAMSEETNPHSIIDVAYMNPMFQLYSATQIASYEQIENLATEHLNAFGQIISAYNVLAMLKDPELRKNTFNPAVVAEYKKRKAKDPFFSVNDLMEISTSFVEENSPELDARISPNDKYFAEWLKNHGATDKIVEAEKDREEFIDRIGQMLSTYDHSKDGRNRTADYSSGERRAIEEKVMSIANPERKVQYVTINELFENANNASLNKLNAIDVLKIGYILESLQDERIKQELGFQINSDIYDFFSEHGGAAVLGEDFKIHFLEYNIPHNDRPKLVNNNQLEFQGVDFNAIPTAKGTISSLGTYHFHATDLDDKEYAHPSDQDLKSANETGIDGILITKLPGQRINIDFYNSRGTVVDIGDFEYQTLIGPVQKTD